jgi:sn-glycerol 3-phosphate transport system ATP-binding protein
VVNKLEPRERGCAMVFQNYALYPHMTVAENIGYALKVAGVARSERSQRIAKVAGILGVEELLDRKPSALSGGQRQRVAMGRAMIREPRVFLFDEPLSNLDAKLRVQMRVEIRRLHRRLKATSVFVTHDQIEAMTLADRLVVMNQGRIEQVGAPAYVYRRPASRFVAGFIGSPPMNFLEARMGAPDMAVLRDGSRLRLAEAAGRPLPETPVILGFRPEEARLEPRPGPDALPFELELVEELGAGRLLHGRIAGWECVLALASGAASSTGEKLFVHLPAESIHLFDADSGTRLAPARKSLAAQ